MKTLTVRQLASIKRTAQNVYPMVSKKNKLVEKVKELEEEIKDLETQIKSWEGAVMTMTEGYCSEEVITRVVVPALNEDGTPKIGPNGPIKMTKYEPNADILSYDEDKKVYVIKEPKNVFGVTSELPDVPAEISIETEDNNTIL